jgi:hypothetical protein
MTSSRRFSVMLCWPVSAPHRKDIEVLLKAFPTATFFAGRG